MKHGIVLALVACIGSPAQAAEIFGGLYVHDVDTPLTRGGFERGADVQLGWRGDRLRGLNLIGAPSPHLFGSIATAGSTHFAAAGLSWRIGGRFFVRPGIGLAVHSRSREVVRDGVRADLGSRILFAPEVGAGFEFSDRLAVEASWVHLSHAQLFSRQNPGMDSIGLRVTYRLD